MSKTLLSTLIASLFVAAPALAQSDEPFLLRGSATIGGIYNNQDANNTAKLEEYQDLGNGALTNIGIQGRGGKNWIDAYGENFGRTDQYMFLRGGLYDMFKYGAYSNSIPHNFATPAITPFNGVGGGTLVTTFPQLNPEIWTQFDLGYKRVDNGGFVEWQGLTPWYFRADGNQVTFDGTKVGSAANGTSPGQGYTDLPTPVQTKTNNFGAEAGYQTKTMTFALRWDYSKFSNDFQTFDWTNPFFGNRLDTSYLAPDNEFNKITATANFRGLPMNSVIAARYTYSTTKSDVNLATTAVNGATIVPANELTNPNVSTFNGDYINQSFALGWTANPAKNVDTRVYYYWTDMKNDSTFVEYNAAAGLSCGGPCDNELFSYRKNNIGFDVWWRFAKGQRVGGGYDYLDLDQERLDYNSMKWNKFWLEYKNTVLDTLSARLKYQYIDRTSDYLRGNAGTGPNPTSPEYLFRFTSAFDMQAMKGNWLKLTMDWVPVPLVGVSFEGIWKDNDYQNHTLGRSNDKRQEYYLTASYGDATTPRVTAFVDWEQVKYSSDHRYIGVGTCTAASGLNCFDPASPPVALAYNWSSGTKDQNWAVGVGLDWPVSTQWMIKASYLYFETDGSADFQAQNNFGNPINISNFDDTKRQSFNLKGIYSYDKAWSFTLGYAYEKWTYDDVGYTGYQYTVPYPAVATSTSQSYLNGYNAFTNGDQNIVYGYVTYRF